MTTIDSFVNRLKKIGITVELAGNYPWVYLETVNGYEVNERFYANHGFTAFFYGCRPGQETSITDIRSVFKKIRDMLSEEGRKKDMEEYELFLKDYHQ